MSCEREHSHPVFAQVYRLIAAAGERGGSASVLRYWYAPPWTARVRSERFITACRQMAEEGTGARLAVDRVSDGEFLGWSSLNRWNPDYRSASLGYCFDEAAWGHGYATEAARALLRWHSTHWT